MRVAAMVSCYLSIGVAAKLRYDLCVTGKVSYYGMGVTGKVSYFYSSAMTKGLVTASGE